MEKIGRTSVSLETREAFQDGHRLQIGERAFDILELLIQAQRPVANRSAVATRRYIGWRHSLRPMSMPRPKRYWLPLQSKRFSHFEKTSADSMVKSEPVEFKGSATGGINFTMLAVRDDGIVVGSASSARIEGDLIECARRG